MTLEKVFSVKVSDPIGEVLLDRKAGKVVMCPVCTGRIIARGRKCNVGFLYKRGGVI